MTHIGIANWTEDGRRLRLVATIELRVGDLAGDLAERGFQTIEHEPCPAGALTASFTHQIINRGKRRGYDDEGGGAGLPEIPADAVYDLGGISPEQYAHLRELADRWHLNTMRAGCAHQTPVYAPDQYSRNAPSLDLTPPCPITGYKYGHAWLVEVLPAEVLTELARYGVHAPTVDAQ